MSLANSESANVDRTGLLSSGGGPPDHSVEPGFLLEPLPGLDSFGSEDADDEPLRSVAFVPSLTANDSPATQIAIGPTVRRSILADFADPIGRHESPPVLELTREAVGAGWLPTLRRMPATALSFVRRTSTRLGHGLGLPLRWLRRRVNPAIAVMIVLTVVGIGEAGWIGVRAAKGFKQFTWRKGADAAIAENRQPNRTDTPPPTAPVVVRIESKRPDVPPESTKVPGWVAVTTPVPLEILERGRVIGASWNGGVRLAPGRHAVRIVNRAAAVDVERILDIAAGSTTSMAVEFLPGLVRINASPRASVRVDGKAVGTTPVVDLQLAGGPHDVLFSHPRLGERRMTINVLPGKPLQLDTDLRR